MDNRKDIALQEEWSKALFADFVEDRLPEGQVRKCGRYEHYDIEHISGEKVTAVEVKQWTNDPQSYESLILKQDKVEAMRRQAGEGASLYFIAFHVPTAKAYVYDLVGMRWRSGRRWMLQKVVNFCSEPEWEEFYMWTLPVRDAHVEDITQYLERHGRSCEEYARIHQEAVEEA